MQGTHSRSVAELQPFLASTHHYAIWDDHDYGPNDSDRGFYNKIKHCRHFAIFGQIQRMALEILRVQLRVFSGVTPIFSA